MEITKTFHEFKKKIQPGKQLFKNSHDYRDRLIDLTLSDQSITNRDNLEEYLLRTMNNKLPIVEMIRLNGRSFQNDFSGVLFDKFFHLNDTLDFLDNYDLSAEEIVERLELVINRLYNAFKDYLISYMQFYIDNPGLSYCFKMCHSSTVGESFYDYVKKDTCLKNYDTALKETLYLKLIDRMISNRYLELRESEIKGMIAALSKFVNSKNSRVCKVAEGLRSKLYKYNGIKCPDHLIFIPTLSSDQAQKIAEFISPRFFNSETSVDAVAAALKGMLHVLPEDNEKLASLYRLNPSSSYPLVIKKAKLGYVAYLYYKLQELDYITQERLWHSISKFKYFKTINSKNLREFVRPNQLSKSLSNKRRRLNKYKGTTPDLELELLDDFLNKILN